MGGIGSGDKPLFKLSAKHRESLFKLYYSKFTIRKMAAIIGISYSSLYNVMNEITTTTKENIDKIKTFLDNQTSYQV